MRPDDRDFDEEIRGHLAISVKERIDRGEDPEAARLAALREFGYIPNARDSMRRVWYGRWFDAAEALLREMRIGLRSLVRARGFSATVVVTLALGIGANAAIFSVVRGVLLRPLVNRDEDRLVYIRQSAPGDREVPGPKSWHSECRCQARIVEYRSVDPGRGSPGAVAGRLGRH